jgi:predicted transcriptional regulator
MKRKDIYTLDKDDDKAISLFVKLGMPKNLAKTLLYVSQVDECKCADVEQGANLRQPEVSIAMQELRRRGWVKKRDLKKEGKGRPVHVYKPTMQLTDIVKTIESEKLKEVASVEADISKLRNIIDDI